MRNDSYDGSSAEVAHGINHFYLLNIQETAFLFSKVNYMLADPNDRVKFVVRNDSYKGSPAEVAHGIYHVYLFYTQENSISVSKVDYIITDPNDGEKCLLCGMIHTTDLQLKLHTE